MNVTGVTAATPTEEQIVCPECGANCWQAVWTGWSTAGVTLTNLRGELDATCEYEPSYDGDSYGYRCQSCGFELDSSGSGDGLPTETVELPVPATPLELAEKAVAHATRQLERAQTELAALTSA